MFCLFFMIIILVQIFNVIYIKLIKKLSYLILSFGLKYGVTK